MHLPISSGISDHVGGWRLRSRHGCNRRHHWRPGNSDSYCRHEAHKLIMRAADMRRFRLQRRQLWLLLLLVVVVAILVKLALHCFSPLYDLLNLVYAFVVAACPADRLLKVVEHGPRASRHFAQEAFLSCRSSRTVGHRRVSSSHGGHHCKLATMQAAERSRFLKKDCYS